MHIFMRNVPLRVYAFWLWQYTVTTLSDHYSESTSCSLGLPVICSHVVTPTISLVKFCSSILSPILASVICPPTLSPALHNLRFGALTPPSTTSPTVTRTHRSSHSLTCSPTLSRPSTPSPAVPRSYGPPTLSPALPHSHPPFHPITSRYIALTGSPNLSSVLLHSPRLTTLSPAVPRSHRSSHSLACSPTLSPSIALRS